MTMRLSRHTSQPHGKPATQPTPQHPYTRMLPTLSQAVAESVQNERVARDEATAAVLRELGAEAEERTAALRASEAKVLEAHATLEQVRVM